MIDGQIGFFYLFIFISLATISRAYFIDSEQKINSPHVSVLDCTNEYSNVYYDMDVREWKTQRYATCLVTRKDLLSFCQRVYPQLNVINIVENEQSNRFTVFECSYESADSNKRTNCSALSSTLAKTYKCLYGEYKSTQIQIPPMCQFQNLYSPNDACQSNDYWRAKAREKCKALDSYLNVSALLQWCDAFQHGISSFKGIEFVCCPRSTDTRSRTNKEDGDIDYDDDNDDNQEEYEYEDESSSNQESDEDEDDDDDKQGREDFSAKKKKKEKSESKSKTHSNSLFIFMLVASSLLILGFVFKKQLKKRWLMLRSTSRRNEFIQANTTVGYGEEGHHVNSMQVNGYENPTYKLFENPNASNT